MNKYYNNDLSASAHQLPTVFISYNQKSSSLVDEIVQRLTGKAQVLLDKKNVRAWGSFTDFMKSIRLQDFAVLVISEAYLKSTACLFEVMQLMKDENWSSRAMYVVLNDANIYKPSGRATYIQYWASQCLALEEQIKALPCSSTAELSEDLRKSVEIRDSIGTFLSKVADSSNPSSDKVIQAIVDRVQPTVASSQKSNPKKPTSIMSHVSTSKASGNEKPSEPTTPHQDETVHIVGVITEEVTVPRNDGTRGSALYKVPLRLSKRVSTRWGQLFVQAWNHPPLFSTMHRPGIASVYGDKIILNGTTIEEIRDYHKKTLSLCVDIANKQEAKELEAERQQKVREEQQRQQHRENVESIASELLF